MRPSAQHQDPGADSDTDAGNQLVEYDRTMATSPANDLLIELLDRDPDRHR